MGNNRTNSEVKPTEFLEIKKFKRLLIIEKNDDFAGLEIHLEDNILIDSFTIDEGWELRTNKNKIIIYNTDLQSMKKDFTVKFENNVKAVKVIISDKLGRPIKSRIYKNKVII